MISIRERGKIGVGLFILSEMNFFLLLIIAYVYYHAYPGPGPTAATALNTIRTGMFSLALFSSSATIWMASRAARRSDRGGLMLWLSITIALGVLFMFGQATEYYDLLTSGVTVSRNLFATTFFTLTGFHGPARDNRGWSHYASRSASRARANCTNRQATASAMLPVEMNGTGDFVDAVWVVVFSVVYLWGAVAS